MDDLILEKCIGFEWDHHNQEKNWNKHKVLKSECEQAFFNKPCLFFEDAKHSHAESRFYMLGKTDWDRKLFIVFTIRNQLIRVISARDMNKKERQFYEQT